MTAMKVLNLKQSKFKINYIKASLNLKRALWGDKPEGLLPENCPNFSFFFVWAGTLWALVTSPSRGFDFPDFGPGKLEFSQEN
jgi:hypothetical protein